MGGRRPPVDLADREDQPVFRLAGHVCDWFLLCDNVATRTVAHPILGSVWCCERCAAKLDLTFEES